MVVPVVHLWHSLYSRGVRFASLRSKYGCGANLLLVVQRCGFFQLGVFVRGGSGRGRNRKNGNRLPATGLWCLGIWWRIRQWHALTKVSLCCLCPLCISPLQPQIQDMGTLDTAPHQYLSIPPSRPKYRIWDMPPARQYLSIRPYSCRFRIWDIAPRPCLFITIL